MEPRFYIPDEVRELFLAAGKAGHEKAAQWKSLIEKYQKSEPKKAADLRRRIKGDLPKDWDAALPQFPADAKGMATRVASGQTLNALAAMLPELVGGSADLTPSNNTWLKESTAFEPGNPLGRYFHFGVREHGMGAVVNGMAYHGGLIPFGATFLIFTDYMRGALRLSALSHLHSIWVMTHDSVGLGEDGPTHQPVEHLASLRAIPNMTVIRPGDANETREAWKSAIEHKTGPTLLALSRQSMPTLDRNIYSSAEGLAKGAYILADLGKGTPEIILMASGSEVSLIVGAGEALAKEGHSVRLVSFPSWELFEKAGKEYQAEVLPKAIKKRIAVEMASPMGWERWVGDDGEIIGIDHYGASAPLQAILKGFGFTVENVYAAAKAMLAEKRK